MDGLLPNRFVNNKLEEVNLEEVVNAKIISLLFTASWCSPCVIFEKELVELYNEVNIGEKLLEIIHVSFDKSEETFRKAISNKPWLFIPHADSKVNELCERFEVTSIPVFLVLNKDGTVLTQQGRKEISEEGPQVVDRWLLQVE